MCGVVRAVLKALALAFIFKSCISATIHHQSGCYNTDVILSCPHYTQTKPGKLVWLFSDKTASTWTQIASIMRNGSRSLSRHNSTLDNRLTIHPNGSLGIASLHPDDERRYQCKTYMKGIHVHVTNLEVSCGKVTKLEHQVCTEDDVVLECKAKHRTNPRKLNQIKWHKKNTSGNDVSWSLLVATSGSNVTVGDGFKLLGNGSLLLQGGRDESNVTYKCDVTKNVTSRLDRHIIVVKNVKCRKEGQEIEGSTVKTTTGRVAMTTPIVVTMETSTPTLPSGAVSCNLGSNYICLYIFVYSIVSWVITGRL